MPISLLSAPFLGPEAQRVCTEIEIALTQALPLLRHLLSAGIFVGDLQAAVNEIRRGAPSMSPGMTRKARAAALLVTRQRSPLLKLLTSVRDELPSGRAESHGLTCSAGTITVHTKKRIRRFQERAPYTSEVLRESRVLIIDANADEQLVDQFFDVAVFDQIYRLGATRRSSSVDRRGARRHHSSQTAMLTPRASRQRRSACASWRDFSAASPRNTPRVLVVGPQEITGNPNAKIKPLIKVPCERRPRPLQRHSRHRSVEGP